MRIVLVIACTALLYSCNHENLKYDKPYFDFDSLVHTQVQKLGEAKGTVIKKTFLNGKKDSTAFMPDTTQWKHELDSFQQLDVINKPMYKGNYLRTDLEDAHSNLLVRSYSAKIKSLVPEVKFFYQEGFKKLKRIEAVFIQKNVLYSTSRKMTLEFDEQHGATMISAYRVQGFQKMILSDSVKFTIEGRLTYP